MVVSPASARVRKEEYREERRRVFVEKRKGRKRSVVTILWCHLFISLPCLPTAAIVSHDAAVPSHYKPSFQQWPSYARAPLFLLSTAQTPLSILETVAPTITTPACCCEQHAICCNGDSLTHSTFSDTFSDMPVPSKRRRSDSVDETDEQLVACLVRDTRHSSMLEQPDQFEMNEYISEWLDRNNIRMNSQRKRGFRKRARDQIINNNNTDYSSVILPKWCYREVFLLLVPPTMLTNQPRPMLVHRISQYYEFVAAGGLDYLYPSAAQSSSYRQ
jgi:hypothetical protein